MRDCHVCGLPMEVQVVVEARDGEWVTLVCVDQHMVVLRASELDQDS